MSSLAAERGVSGVASEAKPSLAVMASCRSPEVREVLRDLNRITDPLERRLRPLVPTMRDDDFYAVLYPVLCAKGCLNGWRE